MVQLTRLEAQIVELQTRVAAHGQTVEIEAANDATSTANWWACETQLTRAGAHRKTRLATAPGHRSPRAGPAGARRRRAAGGPGRGDHRRDRGAPRGPRPRDPLPGTDHPAGVRRRARRQSPTHPRQTDPRGDRTRDRRGPRSQGPREGGARRRGGREVPDVRGRPRQVPRPVHPPQHPRRDAQEGPDGLRRPQAPSQRGRTGTRTRTPVGPPDGPGVHGVRRAATRPTGCRTPAACPPPSWSR